MRIAAITDKFRLQGGARISRLALAMGVILIVTIAVSAGVSAWLLRGQAVDEWRRQMESTSIVLAEQTSQTVASAYLALDGIAERVEAAHISDANMLREKMSTADAYRILVDKTASLPQVDVATIVASNGDVINFTRAYPAPPINLSDRDYFKVHASDPNVGVFISAPVRNKGNGRWTFYLSRRLNGSRGEFIGMALIGLSSDFFSGFYGKISLEDKATLTLYRRDFTLLARWPHVDDLVGKVNRTGASYAIIEGQKRASGVLVTETPRFSEGEKTVYRMGAARLLDKYPLIVNVTITDDLFLAGWHRSTRVIATVAAGSIVALLISFCWLAVILRRREAEMEITLDLKRQAEAANRAKSAFLAMMSHEIRTPLTAIIGFAEMLLGRRVGENMLADKVGIILRNARHLLELINEILDLSKVEAGQLQIEQVEFAPSTVIWSLDSSYAAQARDKGLKFQTLVQYPFPSSVLGDPTRWRQILFNLYGNAIKFTEHGGVTVTFGYDAHAAKLRCTVSDTGIGIDPEQLERLFRPFAQADVTVTRKFGGTGLGLYLVRKLAERMGGGISVASKLGEGTTFEVEVGMPLAEGQAMLTADLRSWPSTSDAPQADLTPVRGRVLLAEDGPDNQLLISAFLDSMGVTYKVVSDGEQAVEQALAEDFDLILMDMQMPVMDGVMATEILRGAGYGAPIIGVTANVMVEEVKRYLEVGCNRCVAKPIDFQVLGSLMREYLAASQVSPETASITDLPEFAALKTAFESGLPADLDKLDELIQQEQWDEARRLAHTLKGTAGSFGYPRVTELASTLEASIKSGRTGEAAPALAALNALEEVRRLTGAAEMEAA